MKKAVIIIFIISLVFPTITWIFTKPTLDYPLNENRELAQFPELDVNFLENLDEYVADNCPYRSLNIKINSKISLFLSDIYIKILKKFNLDEYESKNNVLFGQNDWLFYLGDCSMDDYRGSNLPTDYELEKMLHKATIINNYFQSQGKEFVIFIPPNKENVYSEFMPKNIFIKSQRKRVDVIRDYITQNSSVKFIHPKEYIISNKSNEQLYYKYDTHWNQAGAWYGTEVLLNNLNLPVPKVTLTSTEKYGGDLLAMIAGENKLDVEYNYSIEDGYNKVDKKIFFVGDSFRMAMRGYINGIFDSSSILHRDEMVKNNYVNELNSSDIIVVEAVERYTDNLFRDGGFLDYIINTYNIS